MHLAALARYPFLPEAAGHVANEGPSLEDLLSERVYAEARARGRERVLAAIENAELPTPPLAVESSPRDLLEDLLSYVYGRILVSATKDAYVVRRHALAEAVRAKAYLDHETDPTLVRAAAEAVGLAFEPEGPDAFRGHFTEYLRYAVHLKDLDWKLVRQPLGHGFVRIERPQLARLVQEALRRRIETELPKPLPDEVLKAVEADLAPLREAARIKQEQFATDGFGKVELPLLPPCMHHILGQLQRGENVAHSGRFALVTFLHAIGMTSEDIMRLFSTAPDFREDLTRYQVEHITGVTSGTTYTPPGCQAMQTFGICYNADDVCRSRKKDGDARVKHPLTYYRMLKEANAVVEPIVARIPVENVAALRKSAAMNYGLLKRLEEVAASPHLAQVALDDVLGVVQQLGLSIQTAGEGAERKLVFDDGARYALPDLLASNAIRLVVARKTASAATTNPTTTTTQAP